MDIFLWQRCMGIYYTGSIGESPRLPKALLEGRWVQSQSQVDSQVVKLPPFLSVSLPSWIFLRDSLRWSGQYTIIYSCNAFWLIIDYSPGVVIGKVKYCYYSKSILSETPLEKFHLQKSSQHPKHAAFLTTNRLHSDFASPDFFLDSSSESSDSQISCWSNLIWLLSIIVNLFHFEIRLRGLLVLCAKLKIILFRVSW